MTATGRTRLAAGILAFAVAAIGLGDSAIASSHRAQAKPTVVLIHGGWADSSGWNSELTALQRRGRPRERKPRVEPGAA